MAKEVGLLEDLVQSVRFLWRHRKGNEVVGAILDTFDKERGENGGTPSITLKLRKF